MRRLRRALENAATAGAHADKSLGLIDELVLELKDGVSFKLIRKKGGGSFMDFFTGEIDELPLEVRLEIEEDGE